MLRLRDHHRALLAELERYGIKPAVGIDGAGHIRFRWKEGARERRFVSSFSPSDHRTPRNELARLRRLLRQGGGSPAPAARANGHQQANGHHCAACEARLARLERDMATVLELLTNHMPAPEPEPEPEPPKSIRPRRHKISWVFSVLRYDEFLTVQQIAKAAGRSMPTTAVQLSAQKKKGLVEHRRGEGWRKHRSVESLH